MLYLPAGIRNFVEEMAMRRAVSMGKLLIEIVCKFAWEKGFRCDHPPQMVNFDKKLTAAMHKAQKYDQSVALHRCKRCGMIFKIGARLRSGAQALECLGYPFANFVHDDMDLGLDQVEA